MKLRALFQTKLHLVQLPLLILFRKLAELHQAELTTPFKYGRYVLNLQNWKANDKGKLETRTHNHIIHQKQKLIFCLKVRDIQNNSQS